MVFALPHRCLITAWTAQLAMEIGDGFSEDFGFSWPDIVANTAGAIFGTFLTGFVLLAALPTRPIIFGVGGLLSAVALAAFRKLDRGHRDAADSAAACAATITIS